MYKKIKDVKIDGFAINSAAQGETVKMRVKDWTTSGSPLFYVYAEQIGNIIFPKLGILNFRDVVNYNLTVIHPDNTADVYAQDFKVITKIKPNRSIKKGESVYAKDITEITEVRFPDISINVDDRIVFLMRSGWKFGIFFDFTRKIDSDTLASDIAKLQKYLILEDVLKNALAEIRTQEAKADLESGGTPAEIYEAFIMTEGKTDKLHLKTGFRSINYKRKLRFSDSEEDLADTGLLKMCELAIHGPIHKVPLICIFDRDNPEILKKLAIQSGGVKDLYQSWGNNVFSFALPVPTSRTDYKHISIEMYYNDDVIRRTNSDGKRLFFDNELILTRPVSGGELILNPITPIEKDELVKKVYSKDVKNIRNSTGICIGLSKTAFAELLCSGQKPFQEVNFDNFKLIADVIEKIIAVK